MKFIFIGDDKIEGMTIVMGSSYIILLLAEGYLKFVTPLIE
jgi:hypothetical protein